MSDLTEKPIIRINRDVLEKFLPDNNSIRKFEELLRVLNNLVPEDLQMLLTLIEEAQIENSSNRSKINSVESLYKSLIQLIEGTSEARFNSISSLYSILKKSVELLESKPNPRQNRKPFIDYIDFYENGNVVDKPGRVYWKDSDDKSLNIVMNDAGVVLQVGQEQYYLAKNTTGSTILNGSLCKFTGTVGASGKLTVGLGYGLDDENVLMGVATQDIANNEFGFVTHFGLIRGIDTTGSSYGETWVAGDFLYPSSTVAGRFTNIRPDAPNLREPLASVVYSGGSNGSIFVRMKTGETIDHLHDVQLSSLSDEDILLYVAANSRWENSNILSTKMDKVTLTDNAIVRANGTSGDIQDSGVTIDDSDNIIGANSIYLGGLTSANQLDDYEEGSWTPVLSDGTNTLSGTITNAKYVKVGKMVKASFYGTFNLSSHGLTSTSSVRVGGLPFVPSEGFCQNVDVVYCNLFTTDETDITVSGYVGTSDNQVRLYKGSSRTWYLVSELTTGTAATIMLSIVYFAN